ncbi:MAG: NACHT domain-containing protein [Chloroflexi bacterium]|nr:NACHT domain-containing protein [Chloroflexota bacterium]
MDPFTQSVVAGMLANVLTGLLGKVFDDRDAEAEFIDALAGDGELAAILEEGAEATAEDTDLTSRVPQETLRDFLLSPEVETLLRQLVASRLITEEKPSDETLKGEFEAMLAIHLACSQPEIQDLAAKVFRALLRSCERALALAVDNGVLSAHEAMSAARHRAVVGELQALNKNLALVTSAKSADIKGILTFEQKYRSAVGARHAYIVPPHFDAARKLSIDQLYVAPGFVRRSSEPGEEHSPIQAARFLRSAYRSVILGHPGGGKSTFALKVCHYLATQYTERLFGGRLVTPILVILRDYGAEKKERRCSILQFMESTANAKYQIEPPPGAFDYLLLSGRAIVIFDGLDELLDTTYRQEVSADIESFSAIYPSVPILVTSREVGYEQAPLDDKSFETWHLAPFDDEQVSEYAKKWFAADQELTQDEQHKKAERFLEESSIVPDLRSNPLMLALMCNIYRGENYIPRNRPDVYEKCAVMLFERWDKSRGIFVPLPFEAHISPALMYLAHWIYTNEAMQSGLTEKLLVHKAKEYLCPRRFEDPDEAQKAAEEFIAFCKGRAWVFTDTGTTGEGESLYQFTHRTFLEYFTAAHLVRTHPTPEPLGRLLRPRIERREWDVVAQLAFQLQNKNVEGAGDALLDSVVSAASQVEDRARLNLVSFAARCLEFVVPSPRVTKGIAKTCLVASIARVLDKTGDMRTHTYEPPWRRENGEAHELLGALVNSAIENRAPIAEIIEGSLIDEIKGHRQEQAIVAAEMGLELDVALIMSRRGESPSESLEFWRAVSGRIFDECTDRIVALSASSRRLAMDTLWRDAVSLSQFVEWYGVHSLFEECVGTAFSVNWTPVALALVWPLFSWNVEHERTVELLERRVPQLEQAGEILLSTQPPWRRPSKHGYYGLSALSPAFDGGRPKRLKLSKNALFGAFAIVAGELENNAREEPVYLQLRRLRKAPLRFLRDVGLIASARFGKAKASSTERVLRRYDFTAKQQRVIRQWARGAVNLVG